MCNFVSGINVESLKCYFDSGIYVKVKYFKLFQLHSIVILFNFLNYCFLLYPERGLCLLREIKFTVFTVFTVFTG